MNVADFVAEALARSGVTHVFGGHGGAVVPLIESIEKHPKLTWVYMRNEANASLAAHAAGKLDPNVVGCCLATSGPGCTNLTTGLVCGKTDAVPMIAITGLKPSYKSGLVDFQDIENDRLFAGVLDWSKRVVHPFQAPQLMRDAIAYALTHRTAVHIAFPEDIQESPLDPCHKLYLNAEVHTLPLVGPPQDAVEQAVSYLCDRTDKRILILVGHLAVHSGKEILELAEILNAPIVTRLDAKGVVDELHPLCIGVAGVHGSPGLAQTRDIIESCDCVIAIGVEDQMLAQNIVTGGMQNREVVYVMPDQATVTGQFTASAALIGDISISLNTLNSKLKDSFKSEDSIQEGGFPEIFVFWQKIKSGAWRDGAIEHPIPLKIEDSSTFCHPIHIYNALNKRLGKDDTLSVDTGDQTLWASSLAKLSNGTRTISDEFMGTMGYALPAAIAMSLHKPLGTHVAVVGDGASQMSINELATARQFNSRIVMIIFVNGVLGRVRYGFGPDEIPGTEIGAPDFVALAKAYGGDGAHVRCSTDAEIAVEKAFTQKGLFVIEVTIDRHLSAHMETFRAGDHELMHFTLQLGDRLPEPMQHLRRPVALHELMEICNKDLQTAKHLLDSLIQNYGEDSKMYVVPPLDAYLMKHIWMQSLHSRLDSSTIFSVAGPTLREQIVPSEFPGSAPIRLLKNATGIELPENWQEDVRRKLPDLVSFAPEEWASVGQTGTSNNRRMNWVVISIPPNKSFPMHAHPSIEVIYVADGVLYENRITYKRDLSKFSTDCLDLDTIENKETIHRSFSKGQMLFNEIGSIHQSFSKDEGTVLLCLWSGGHTEVVSHAHDSSHDTTAHEIGFDCCLREQSVKDTVT